MYKDLVVGTGAAASASKATVQYVGVLYRTGKCSTPRGTRPGAQFSLTPGSCRGFTQGIGGTAAVRPMKVGGRRIIIMPASLAYGADPRGAIPANSALVFVVDLQKLA